MTRPEILPQGLDKNMGTPPRCGAVHHHLQRRTCSALERDKLRGIRQRLPVIFVSAGYNANDPSRNHLRLHHTIATHDFSYQYRCSRRSPAPQCGSFARQHAAPHRPRHQHRPEGRKRHIEIACNLSDAPVPSRRRWRRSGPPPRAVRAGADEVAGTTAASDIVALDAAVKPASWVATLCGRNDLPVLRADDLTDDMLADVARAALRARSETRSVFTPANIYADVERQLHGIRFARDERAKVADRAVSLGLGMAVKLTAPEMLHVPGRFRTPDGVSQFTLAAGWQYSTQDLLDAEARLLDAGRDTAGPTVNYGTIAAVSDRPLPGRTYGLGADQAVAVEQIAASGRTLDLLVGPAGTGKTTTLAAAAGRLGDRCSPQASTSHHNPDRSCHQPREHT